MTRQRALIVALVAVTLVGVGGVAWFLGREQPEAVDIERAIAGVTAEGAAAGATEGAGAEGEQEAVAPDDAPITDATGTWQVVADLATFDTLAGTGTWVGYRIDEELSGRGAFTAVGRTPEVSGTVTIEGTAVTAAQIRADLTQLQSDSGSRDSRVRGEFQGRDAVFTLDEPFDVGSLPSDGQRVTASARGTLRIGAIERPVTVLLEADLVGSTLVVVGRTDILLADFDVRVPSAPIVLSVSDTATMELQLRLRRE
jgi:polyisoprenoid-binding protein YceI